MIVLDTHIFLWYSLDDPALTSEIRLRLAENPDSVFVPSIVVWETVMLSQKGRLNIYSNQPDQFARRLLARSSFREMPLNSEIAILSRTLKFEHDDPADRFIAATAYFLDFPLATEDRRLLDLPWLSTV